jgi:hypothetical protein
LIRAGVVKDQSHTKNSKIKVTSQLVPEKEVSLSSLYFIIDHPGIGELVEDKSTLWHQVHQRCV